MGIRGESEFSRAFAFHTKGEMENAMFRRN